MTCIRGWLDLGGALTAYVGGIATAIGVIWLLVRREIRRRSRSPQTSLDAELQARLWALFDASKTACERDTPAAWAALHRAVADVPESQRPVAVQHERTP